MGIPSLPVFEALDTAMTPKLKPTNVNHLNKRRKSALPKRRMQWLRRYLDSRWHQADGGVSGQGQDATEILCLVEAARKVGRKVVLKRADDGPVVAKPSGQVSSSKIVRYDLYSGVCETP